MAKRFSLRAFLGVAWWFACCGARADPARFDLAGPKVEVRVTRGGKTLPVDSVPNLQGGDRIWVRPDLPLSQSVRYLMVVTFLRGTTNPPPDDWFTKIETWNKKVREEGVEVTVPAEAEQALVFLAPATGGDFGTLKSAVRGRPGVFVRASQDLNEAGFEQGRIEKYLASIKMVPPGDAKALLDHSNLLARTLALRPNPECFKRDADQQATCLTQTGSQTLLDDGHGQTIVAALTTGSSSELISAASYTQMAGGGVYSAYVGAIVDLARLLGGLHTAQYQYIPAIAFPQQESLNLRLNTPPSFHNPKSVIVIGLPAIQRAVTPPLRSPDPQHVSCLLEPRAAIPLDGAPLVFSTGFAHDLVLHLDARTDAGTDSGTGAGTGGAEDVPVSPDAYLGGLVVEKLPQRRALEDAGPGSSASASQSASAAAGAGAGGALAGATTGTVRGFWGFDRFEGPVVRVQVSPGEGWKVRSGEPLIAGRDDRLVLTSTGNACLESITFDSGSGASLKVAAKPAVGADAHKDVDVDLPLASAAPGSLHLAIHQHGVKAPTLLAVRTYSDPAKLDGITIHAGDRSAVLKGRHLDQVRDVILGGVRLVPRPGGAGEEMRVEVADGSASPAMKPGEKLAAHVGLADGRALDMPVTVAAARPVVTLRARSTPRDAGAIIRLAGNDELRVDEPVTVLLKSEAAIPRNEEIEVATVNDRADQSGAQTADTLSGKLTFASGALVLQDVKTLRVTIDPLKVLGPSVFGPVRLRAVEPGGGASDWLDLGTFVRLPGVSSLVCPPDASKACTLSGSELFLIEAVGNDPAMAAATVVPEDFMESTIAVPHPANGTLYLSLRDDRSAVATLTMPVQQDPTHVATGARVGAAPAPKE